MSYNELAGPQPGAAQPAGWVSPESWEAAQRLAVAQELANEEHEAAKAAREQAITERMASRRIPFQAPGAAPAESNRAVVDGDKDPVTE